MVPGRPVGVGKGVRQEGWGLKNGTERDSWPQAYIFWATEKRSRVLSSLASPPDRGLAWKQAVLGTKSPAGRHSRGEGWTAGLLTP